MAVLRSLSSGKVSSSGKLCLRDSMPRSLLSDLLIANPGKILLKCSAWSSSHSLRKSDHSPRSSVLSPKYLVGTRPALWSIDWSLRPDLQKHIGLDGDLSAERPVVADDQ